MEPDTPLSSYAAKLQLFFRIFFWEFRWLFAFNARRVLTLFGTGLGSIAAQGAAIAAIFLGLNGIESVVAWPILPFTTNLQSGYGLATFTAVVLTFLLLTARLRRHYRIGINRISIAFERDLKIATLRHALSPLTDPHACEPGKIMKGAAKLSGRSLRLVLQASLDALQGFAFMIACLYLQPGLTVIIVIVLVPFFVLQWRLNLAIHRNEIALADAKRLGSDLYDNTLGRKQSLSLNAAVALVDSSVAIEPMTRYNWRLNAASSAEYIAAIGAAVVLAVSLLWLIQGFYAGQVDAGGVAAFVLCVRALMTATISGSVSVASLTRLFEPVKVVHNYFRGSMSVFYRT